MNSRVAVLLTAWAFSFPGIGDSRAQQTTSAASSSWRNGPGLVLLMNNEVLRGEIRVFESTLELRLDETASLNLPIGQVAHVAQTAEELYLFLASQKREWAVGDHTQMCRWCLGQKLFEPAVGHYEAAKSSAGDVPVVRQLAAEVRSALLSDPQVQTALQRVREPNNATNDAVPSKTEATAAPSAATISGSDPRLARATAVMRLTPAEQETFRLQIQPVLVQSCARAACHGAFAHNAFPLMDSRRIDSQSALRHNLETFSTYAARFRFAPGESIEQHPLFVKSAAAHGRQLTPPLDITNPQHQRYLEQLRHWLTRPTLEPAVVPSVAADASDTPPAGDWPAAPPAIDGLPAVAGLPIASFDEQRLRRGTGIQRTTSATTPKMAGAGSLNPGGTSLWEQAAQRGPSRGRPADGVSATAADVTPAAAFADSEVESLAAAIAQLEAVENAKGQGRNPLDPEEFNRRFGPK